MRILIGTPIHISKDYAMERWLENVSKLEYSADLLMVDNSPGLDYMERVKASCIQHGIKNYKIKHIEIDQQLGPDLRIEAAQETIRHYVLSHNYDTWFSWECDQIIPTDALDKLIRIMKMGNFMMVVHNSQARWDPKILNTNMGITLIKKECLEKSWFLPQRNGKISLDVSDSYDINNPNVFKKRVLASGGHYLEVFGVIKPIYHLNK
ncbi:MAG: hypothetical protein UV59_C0033G0020 [Candidatus Gottesmanbacteria bacterium GW2011_GWA1_43_11]|uniref:Glycosyltransferase 2-like domain-containing protein n=1 Tax=Candidatus Gottesmanbacteria bacterium GW2011_GWA1_43_11 TaxID=1618436 RepID=A0A0G1CDW0_9BACT|nr:MAG: hypothetical protein UV59_C0033G0020 [Candidatus Gottesmanbacteria bacterium GW2011_GWA1_43_11]